MNVWVDTSFMTHFKVGTTAHLLPVVTLWDCCPQWLGGQIFQEKVEFGYF